MSDVIARQPNGHFWLKDLGEFRKQVYGQYGEEGIVEEILRRLDAVPGWMVEVGAWDGVYLSNTCYFLEGGSSAVLIETNPERFLALVGHAARHPNRVFPILEKVGRGPDHCLDMVLSRTPIPDDFSFLSVDVEGPDYQVWEALQDYRPKVVMVEPCDGIFPLTYHKVTASQGSTHLSLIRLGEVKGYTAVCFIGNVIFVANECLGLL